MSSVSKLSVVLPLPELSLLLSVLVVVSVSVFVVVSVLVLSPIWPPLLAVWSSPAELPPSPELTPPELPSSPWLPCCSPPAQAGAARLSARTDTAARSRFLVIWIASNHVWSEPDRFSPHTAGRPRFPIAGRRPPTRRAR